MMTIIAASIGSLFLILSCLLFYYKNKTRQFKQELQNKIIENQAINHEKNAFETRSKIDQNNQFINDDELRKRLRDKKYTRP